MIWLRSVMAMIVAIAALFGVVAHAQPASGSFLAGPVNAVFPPAGGAIRKDLTGELDPRSSWTMKGWVRIDDQSRQPRIFAALVDKSGSVLAELGLQQGKVFASVSGIRMASSAQGKVGDWVLVTLGDTGQGLSLQAGRSQPVSLNVQLPAGAVAVLLAPRGREGIPYQGSVASFALWQGEQPATIPADWSLPDEDLIQFESSSPSWPLQVKQYMGQTVPQDPATLPASRAPAQAAPRTAQQAAMQPLTPGAAGRWTIGAWRFVAAPEEAAAAEAISGPGFTGREWLPATVPGTVLTSYIDNGVYPDPAFGLNNLRIPERLNKQDYWYRTEFVVPDTAGLEHLALRFDGINYASEVWVNGQRLGTTEGAFIRGRFVLPARYGKGDRVAIAVRVSPPPNPGIPHEESLAGGPGQNGGSMTIDGPTFAASEGWDWIPGVRDRNTGIWQDVFLEATGAARLGDPHVTTVLPQADNSLAELTFDIPVMNEGTASAEVTVEARFGEIALTRTVSVEPGGKHVVRFSPDEFAQLRIRNPELWWPNGYGKPTLHRLALTARANGMQSDAREIRFGIREVSYELSVVDAAEALQRVAIAPARSTGEKLLDVEHAGIRKVGSGWAVSLARDIASSPALAAAPPTSLAPHLLLRVNGVPIAVRGGNWGMDDWRKRVSRERLEPYFRLHREANVNTIRNWMGQNTEQVFFELADEYGLLVLNDFWLSTQDHNGEPGDTSLFLENAVDTVSRFRHHPSIVMWIGRNEGVPPPVLNAKLEQLVREIDGTRAYLPNSRDVNMANSGPWNYQQPENYFTRHARGFSTEVGTPSFPMLETFQAMMPEADQWPISDSWAYHDWHQGKAGDVAPFMKAMTARLGAPSDLADFEKKAQLLNFEAHRAILEGMNAGLFTRNSGRLLWMTHPAWPSTAWQIYSHDYAAHASFYGFKKGAEPVHVQINLPDLTVAVANSLGTPVANARLRVRNYALDGTMLSDRELPVSAAPYATTEVGQALATSLYEQGAVVLTKLELFDTGNQLLSENLYWLGRDAAAYRSMGGMQTAQVRVDAKLTTLGSENEIRAIVTNESAVPALMVRLSAVDATGKRVLPAYWSDNYVSLLPGETRTVTVRSPGDGSQVHSIGINGWNVEAASTVVSE